MGAGGWILLLIAMTCVVGLIIVIYKYMKEKEEWDAVSEPETGGIISTFAEKPTAQPAEKPEETVKQVNIYVYSASGRKRLCTYCDGENDMTATKCRVCGQMIK